MNPAPPLQVQVHSKDFPTWTLHCYAIPRIGEHIVSPRFGEPMFVQGVNYVVDAFDIVESANIFVVKDDNF